MSVSKRARRGDGAKEADIISVKNTSPSKQINGQEIADAEKGVTKAVVERMPWHLVVFHIALENGEEKLTTFQERAKRLAALSLVDRELRDTVVHFGWKTLADTAFDKNPDIRRRARTLMWRGQRRIHQPDRPGILRTSF